MCVQEGGQLKQHYVGNLLKDTIVPWETQISLYYTSPHTAYLGESSDSVLIGEEWRVIPNLKVKVNCLVCEGGELIAETELEGAVLGCCEGKAVILLLHLLVESCSIWVLQTTVHIIMATGHNLEKNRQEDHQYSCTERKIYSIP